MSPTLAARVTTYAVSGLGAVAVVVLGFALPASAGSEKVRDPGRDVVSGSYFSDTAPTRNEPARRVGDIVRTRVSLGTELVVTTKFRSLAAGVAEEEYDWFIATSEDSSSPWYAVLSVPQHSDDEHFLITDALANQPHCGKADLDRTARTVTLTVPASCLGYPEWVRVANGAMLAIEGQRTYYDDARRDAGVRHGWKFGPRVRAS